MWIIRLVLLVIVLAQVAAFGFFLKRRRENDRLLENRTVNLLAVIVYNLACFLMAGVGSRLLYQTWTGVVFVGCGLGVIRRALREEEVLAKTFGVEWMECCARVPMLLPRLIK